MGRSEEVGAVPGGVVRVSVQSSSVVTPPFGREPCSRYPQTTVPFRRASAVSFTGATVRQIDVSFPW
jgi:hypothetical protein